MAERSRTAKEDRIFVRDGRRSYRKSYSLAEVRYGIAVLLTLALIFAWVARKGAHPDPELYSSGVELLEPAAAPADRGPLPEAIAGEGWSEGPISTFGRDNLYVKINGREDYYKSFGFERLLFVSLVNDDDPATVIDIELFDLGTSANALGAYSGERPPGVTPDVSETGMGHMARNALFLTRGRYYVRTIGSDESVTVKAALADLRTAFEAGMPGEPLPWAYALFAGGIGIDPGRISYRKENAFSFGFATDVYSALLEDDETEIFIVAETGDAAADALAGRFNGGFLQYGSEAGGEGPWIRDRYRGRISGATSSGPWVIGVRAAPDIAAAEAGLATMERAVSNLSAAMHEEALDAKEVSGGGAQTVEGDYGEEGGEGSYGEDYTGEL